MLTKPSSGLLEKFTTNLSLSSCSPPANKLLRLAGQAVDTSLHSSTLLMGLHKAQRAKYFGDEAEKKAAIETDSAAPESHIFTDMIFVVEFSSTCSFKQKVQAKKGITDNGGIISHILNRKVTAVLVWNDSCKDTYKCTKAVGMSIPVLSLQYIEDSLLCGSAKDFDEYVVLGLTRLSQLETGKICGKASSKGSGARPVLHPSADWRKFESYTEGLQVDYLDNSDVYRVPKWSFLVDPQNGKLCVLEIHVLQTGSTKKKFNVITYIYLSTKSRHETSLELRQADSPLQAELLFASLHSHYVNNLQYKKLDYVPFMKGSSKLQQSLFAWTLDSTDLTDTVKNIVEMVWDEAVGKLEKSLDISIDRISRASVEQAEGVLLDMKSNISAGKDNRDLQEDFYNLIPYSSDQRVDIKTVKDISKHLDMIQLLYDLVSVGEATDWNLEARTWKKLKSLNCHIAKCEMDDLPSSLDNLVSGRNGGFRLQNVFTVSRPSEQLGRNTKDRKLLFHASRPENYLGILSRGLLLPKQVVDDFGGRRTDAGNLGHGVYFADDFRTSIGYTGDFSTGDRLMLVCEVVTGNTFETTSRLPDLVEAPKGYDSVKAIGKTEDQHSDFKSNEYCVYNTSQLALRYVLQYTTASSRAVPQHRPSRIVDESEALDTNKEDVSLEMLCDDISDMKDVLDSVLPGLQVEGEDNKPVPLKSIHILASLVDLAVEVTVFQEYCNTSDEPIEAKFVFPLSEMAAVCGFEAYINDKHIIGEVKEKETAQKEYRKAVSEGHGAYLMVQDKERPDVFTVSVGNLPPHANVLIKIIYVCELAVQDEKFVFELPTNIAPWNAKQALAESTQSTVDKVAVDNQALQDIKCSLELSIQMPFDIREVVCPTHKIYTKKTATQEMVKMRPGQSLENGFILTVLSAEIHVPRMIIENHPDDPESQQACMLTFYPEFECETQQDYELLILLDLSNSMSPADIVTSKKAALVLLNSLNKHVSFNLITFGSTYTELFPKSMVANKANKALAVSYLQGCTARQGNTDLLTPLANLSMLADSSRHRNVVVISDGHMTHSSLTLQAVSSMYGTVRLFTLAVSLNANKFIMRELARVGSGTMEYLNPKFKSKWSRQIRGVLEKAGQPLLSQVQVVWQEQNTDMPVPLQAPACVPSVFNGNRIVVYGFASNCFMATLKALIDGREVSTVVSASPLTASTGLTVHRLAARSVIQDWEHGCLSTDSVEHETKKKKTKASIIEMSKEYGILTQFTSFVAVEKRDEDESFDSGPDIEDLVDDHKTDLLPYMSYDDFGSGMARKVTVMMGTNMQRAYEVALAADMTVQDLKQQLSNESGLPEDQLRLICGSQQMLDKCPLTDYKELQTEDPVIYILLALRGGGGGPASSSFESADEESSGSPVSDEWAASDSDDSFGLCYDYNEEEKRYGDFEELGYSKEEEEEVYAACGVEGSPHYSPTSPSYSPTSPQLCAAGLMPLAGVRAAVSDEEGQYSSIQYDHRAAPDMVYAKSSSFFSISADSEPEDEYEERYPDEESALSRLYEITISLGRAPPVEMCMAAASAVLSAPPPAPSAPPIPARPRKVSKAAQMPPQFPSLLLRAQRSESLAASSVPLRLPPRSSHAALRRPSTPTTPPVREAASPTQGFSFDSTMESQSSLLIARSSTSPPTSMEKLSHQPSQTPATSFGGLSQEISALQSSSAFRSAGLIESAEPQFHQQQNHLAKTLFDDGLAAKQSARPSFGFAAQSQPAQAQSQQTTGLFGSDSARPSFGFSGFAAQSQPAQAQSQQTTGLFGSGSAEPSTFGGSAVQSQPAHTQGQQRAGLFGSGSAQRSVCGFGGSAVQSQSAQLQGQPTTGLFGSGSAQPSTGFGRSAAQSHSAQGQQTTGLFGSGSAQPSTGFGGSAAQSQPAQPQSQRGMSVLHSFTPQQSVSRFGGSAALSKSAQPQGQQETGMFGSGSAQQSASAPRSAFGFNKTHGSLAGKVVDPPTPSSGQTQIQRHDLESPLSDRALAKLSRLPSLPLLAKALVQRQSGICRLASDTPQQLSSASDTPQQLSSAPVAAPRQMSAFDERAVFTQSHMEVQEEKMTAAAPPGLSAGLSAGSSAGSNVGVLTHSELPPLRSMKKKKKTSWKPICARESQDQPMEVEAAQEAMPPDVDTDGGDFRIKLCRRKEKTPLKYVGEEWNMVEEVKYAGLYIQAKNVAQEASDESSTAAQSIDKQRTATCSLVAVITPGVILLKGESDRHLMVSYRALTDLHWNSDLHVVSNEDGDLDAEDITERYTPFCNTSAIEAPIVRRMGVLITSSVKQFRLSALEALLLKAGAASWGKKAAVDILSLFLWKILIFISKLRRWQAQSDAPVYNVVELMDFLDSDAEVVDSEPDSIVRGKTLEGPTCAELMRRYPTILRTLELGKCWSHVLINMMCDSERHQLLLTS